MSSVKLGFVISCEMADPFSCLGLLMAKMLILNNAVESQKGGQRGEVAAICA
jgi:hypothetical protein